MPIEMAPAMSSATPPRTTTRELPRLARPAVNANGTVRPSDKPITLYGSKQFMSYSDLVMVLQYLHVPHYIRVDQMTFILLKLFAANPASSSLIYPTFRSNWS